MMLELAFGLPERPRPCAPLCARPWPTGCAPADIMQPGMPPVGTRDMAEHVASRSITD